MRLLYWALVCRGLQEEFENKRFFFWEYFSKKNQKENSPNLVSLVLKRCYLQRNYPYFKWRTSKTLGESQQSKFNGFFSPFYFYINGAPCHSDSLFSNRKKEVRQEKLNINQFFLFRSVSFLRFSHGGTELLHSFIYFSLLYVYDKLHHFPVHI